MLDSESKYNKGVSYAGEGGPDHVGVDETQSYDEQNGGNTDEKNSPVVEVCISIGGDPEQHSVDR